jgi:hypothetical protein
MTTRTWIGWSLTVAVAGLLGMAGCMDDKGANGDTPLEAERYPAAQLAVDSALSQMCVVINDALVARLETDTGAIPGLEWPFPMPPRRRDGNSNFVDENTSWGVGYNRVIDTTRYVAFWDLGRLVDTGVLIHTSPIEASRVVHEVIYGRIDGFGDGAVEWEGVLKVTLDDLDTETATLSANLRASYSVGKRCNEQPCDSVVIAITDAAFDKSGGVWDLGTLSGQVSGRIRRTEFDVILGYDVVFAWDLSGAIVDGTVNLRLASGRFAQSDTYTVCP